MGFFGFDDRPADTTEKQKVSVDFLHKAECSACPLNRNSGARTPKMLSKGARDADIYFLMAQPDHASDKKGSPFYGEAGQLVIDRIPHELEKDNARFGYIVRTRPQNGHFPTQTEIECCRPSVVRDIEECKPLVVVGFGNLVCDWVFGPRNGGATRWSGRFVPVQIGKHKTWFYPMLDPQSVFDQRRFTPKSLDDYPSDSEFAFALHLRKLLEEYQDLPEPVLHTPEDVRAGVEIFDGSGGTDDLKAIRRHLEDCANEKWVGFDYETKGLRAYAKGAKILTAAFATKKRAVAFALDHSQHQWSSKHHKTIWRMLEEFLYDAPCAKVSHHLQFELEWSGVFFGKDVIRAGKWEDTVAQAYVLDERKQTHSLEFLVRQYFGINIKEMSGVDRDRLDEEPLDRVLTYNGSDAKYHLALFHKQRRRIREEELQPVYDHTLRRIPTLVLTQMEGVPIDQKTVAQFDEEVTEKIEKAFDKIQSMECVKEYERLRGQKFNPGSTHDIKFMLRRVTKSFGKHDAISTDEKVLAEIKHPIGKAIIKWRKHTKLHSTYIAIVKPDSDIIYSDGKIHPIISTTSVDTWRTSSSDPNAQNWPKRGEGVFVRKQVRGKRNQKIVAFDYAGIQARNVAMESKDRKLVDAYWHHYDIHSDWLRRLLRVYPSFVEEGVSKVEKDKDLWKAYRNRAKNEFVFPSFFGAQPRSLSKYLGIPENKAEALWEEFADEFHDIPRWHKRIKKEYYETGYVTGLSGFRRRAPISQNQLINAPIQADESLIVLTAMCALSELDPDKYQPIMEIHDDLTFLWPENEIDERAEVVIREMVKPRFDWVNVPLGVEMSVGDNWCDLKKGREFESHPEKGYIEL